MLMSAIRRRAERLSSLFKYECSHARVGKGRQAASRVSVVNVDDGAEGEAGCACEEPTRECAGRAQRGTCTLMRRIQYEWVW